MLLGLIPPFIDPIHNVQIERLACGTGLFSPIKDRNLFYRHRKCFEKVLYREWTIEPDLQESNFLSAAIQIIHSLMRNLCA